MHATIRYGLSCRICVVQFLFSEVKNSLAHSPNSVLLHYWLLSFQKRFALLCYKSLGQTSRRFASINSVYTNHQVVVTLNVVASRLGRITKFCLLSWDLPIILWVRFRALVSKKVKFGGLFAWPLIFYRQKLCKIVSQVWRTCFLWFVVSGFWIPVPDSVSGFRFPGLRVALDFLIMKV